MIGYQICWPESLHLSSLSNETTAPVSGGFRCASVVTGVMQLPSRGPTSTLIYSNYQFSRVLDGGNALFDDIIDLRIGEVSRSQPPQSFTSNSCDSLSKINAILKSKY